MTKNTYNGNLKINQIYLFNTGSEIITVKITGLYNLSTNSNPYFNVVEFQPTEFKCPVLNEFEKEFFERISITQN